MKNTIKLLTALIVFTVVGTGLYNNKKIEKFINKTKRYLGF